LEFEGKSFSIDWQQCPNPAIEHLELAKQVLVIGETMLHAIQDLWIEVVNVLSLDGHLRSLQLANPQIGREKSVINALNFGLDSLRQRADIPQMSGYSF
jgi:hypothetical protein